MKKLLFTSFILFIFLISLVSAEVNLSVEDDPISDVVIAEFDKPALFNLKITNLGESDDFEIYSLVGVRFNIKSSFSISSGETKELELEVYPSQTMRESLSGPVIFAYNIQDKEHSAQEEELTIRIIKLKDAIAVPAINIAPGNDVANVYIENRENFNFSDIKADFSSPFFSFSEEFDLAGLQKKSFETEIDSDKIVGLEAGEYILLAEIEVENVTEEIEGKIIFVEKSGIVDKEESSGFIIHTRTLEKKNEGNIAEVAQIIVKKNIISRLFTNFNIEPTSVEREGISIYYKFVDEVKPAESLKVVVTTNWIFPFLLIVGIVVIVLLVRLYLTTNVSLEKRVVFVKTKGGEFALKVILKVGARKYVDKVSVIDRLPALVKVYERFGAYPPDKINKEARRLQWNVPSLSPGEERTFTYIIYSKVAVLGKFELPAATAIYEKDGKIKEARSNKAYFIAEQKERVED